MQYLRNTCRHLHTAAHFSLACMQSAMSHGLGIQATFGMDGHSNTSRKCPIAKHCIGLCHTTLTGLTIHGHFLRIRLIIEDIKTTRIGAHTCTTFLCSSFAALCPHIIGSWGHIVMGSHTIQHLSDMLNNSELGSGQE